MKEQRTGRRFSPLLYLLLLSSAILYIWIFSNTPYSIIDDIWWGRDIGMKAFLSGSENSRYVGNLLEIIVTRSEFLKAVLHGLIAIATPFFVAVLVSTRARPGPVLSEKADRLPEAVLLLSNILFLTVPVDVWQDIYGRIAGFSNFGFAVFFLGAFQLLVSRIVLDEVPCFSWVTGLGYFLFGVCIQLVLENVTIYVFLVDIFLLIIMMIEKRSKAAKHLMLFMLAGNAIGLSIMFSSSIYQSLLHSGTAVGGYRELSFDLHDNPFHIFLLLSQRFVYFYPNRMFGNNWLMCSLISVFLFFLSGRGKKLIRFGIRIFTAFFLLYFVFVRFCGPLEKYLSQWNEVRSQWLNLLFFWGVFLSVLLLPWKGIQMRRILIFVWLSVPGIVLPLIAVKLVGSRYFYLSSLFLIEFGMFLFAEGYRDWGKGRRAAECLILAAYLLVSGYWFSIYYDIGQGKRERDALIRAARNGEIDRLCFEELPHSEYLFVNEVRDDDPAGIANFYEFYNIPDSVEFSNTPDGISPEEETVDTANNAAG